MGTININIVYDVIQRDNTYLDIVYNDLKYYYKEWVPDSFSNDLIGNDHGESYTDAITNMGTPCITLLKYEE